MEITGTSYCWPDISFPVCTFHSTATRLSFNYYCRSYTGIMLFQCVYLPSVNLVRVNVHFRAIFLLFVVNGVRFPGNSEINLLKVTLTCSNFSYINFFFIIIFLYQFSLNLWYLAFNSTWMGLKLAKTITGKTGLEHARLREKSLYLVY